MSGARREAGSAFLPSTHVPATHVCKCRPGCCVDGRAAPIPSGRPPVSPAQSALPLWLLQRLAEAAALHQLHCQQHQVTLGQGQGRRRIALLDSWWNVWLAPDYGIPGSRRARIGAPATGSPARRRRMGAKTDGLRCRAGPVAPTLMATPSSGTMRGWVQPRSSDTSFHTTELSIPALSSNTCRHEQGGSRGRRQRRGRARQHPGAQAEAWEVWHGGSSKGAGTAGAGRPAAVEPSSGWKGGWQLKFRSQPPPAGWPAAAWQPPAASGGAGPP